MAIHVSTTEGIEVDGKGLVVVDEDGRTTRKGIFASGDVVQGARIVVEAVYYLKKVVEAMDAYRKDLQNSNSIRRRWASVFY